MAGEIQYPSLFKNLISERDPDRNLSGKLIKLVQAYKIVRVDPFVVLAVVGKLSDRDLRFNPFASSPIDTLNDQKLYDFLRHRTHYYAMLQVSDRLSPQHDKTLPIEEFGEDKWLWLKTIEFSTRQ